VSRFPPPLRTKPPKPTNRAVCAITGLPAKYRDPLSGLPYATAAAFKQLRANRTAQAAAAAAAAAASNAANASAQNPTSSAAPAEEAAAPVRTVIKCTLKLPARSAALANPNCPPQPFVVKPAQP
jgi:vacuolar protein sorting-associated protein 72